MGAFEVAAYIPWTPNDPKTSIGVTDPIGGRAVRVNFNDRDDLTIVTAPYWVNTAGASIDRYGDPVPPDARRLAFNAGQRPITCEVPRIYTRPQQEAAALAIRKRRICAKTNRRGHTTGKRTTGSV